MSKLQAWRLIVCSLAMYSTEAIAGTGGRTHIFGSPQRIEFDPIPNEGVDVSLHEGDVLISGRLMQPDTVRIKTGFDVKSPLGNFPISSDDVFVESIYLDTDYSLWRSARARALPGNNKVFCRFIGPNAEERRDKIFDGADLCLIDLAADGTIDAVAALGGKAGPAQPIEISPIRYDLQKGSKTTSIKLSIILGSVGKSRLVFNPEVRMDGGKEIRMHPFVVRSGDVLVNFENGTSGNGACFFYQKEMGSLERIAFLGSKIKVKSYDSSSSSMVVSYLSAPRESYLMMDGSNFFDFSIPYCSNVSD